MSDKEEKEPIGAETIAQAVIKIDEAMSKIRASGLKRVAIVALVHDQSGVAKGVINTVLNNLENLRKNYTTL